MYFFGVDEKKENERNEKRGSSRERNLLEEKSMGCLYSNEESVSNESRKLLSSCRLSTEDGLCTYYSNVRTH